MLKDGQTNTVVPELPLAFCTQNVHPFLRFYKYDLSTETMSDDELSILLRPENEMGLVKLLQEIGVMASSQ